MSDKKKIFVVANQKGGVGKSTTAIQIIAPYLFEKINGIGTVPSEKTNKVVLFEVDAKNNSKDMYSDSKLFTSKLIKDPVNELEEEVIKELSQINSIPLIIDIGVGYFDKAIENLCSVLDGEDVVYVIPTKPSEDDCEKSILSINRIKIFSPNAKFLIVCSDSTATFSETTALEREFGHVFGKYINMSTGANLPDLFKKAGIPKEFISFGHTDSIEKIRFYFRISFYEGAFIGKELKVVGNKHPLQVRYEKILGNKEEVIKKGDKKSIIEHEISEANIRGEIAWLKKCHNASQNTFSDIFRALDKFLT